MAKEARFLLRQPLLETTQGTIRLFLDPSVLFSRSLPWGDRILSPTVLPGAKGCVGVDLGCWLLTSKYFHDASGNIIRDHNGEYGALSTYTLNGVEFLQLGFQTIHYSRDRRQRSGMGRLPITLGDRARLCFLCHYPPSHTVDTGRIRVREIAACVVQSSASTENRTMSWTIMGEGYDY